MLAQDEKGDLIQAKTKWLSGLISGYMAEALAIEEALSLIQDKGWSKFVVESDCLTAIQEIRS